MQLKEILQETSVSFSEADAEREIKNITADSRRVTAESLFFAIPGSNDSGENYIGDVLKKNAFVVSSKKNDDSFVMYSKSIRIDYAKALSAFYETTDKLDIWGVTGTNGKTTTVSAIKHIFDFQGKEAALISTIYNCWGSYREESSLTTPSAEDLHSMMNNISKEGIENLVLEVSSHAIDQERITGIKFKGKVFTNATTDHLDYHKTVAAYHEIKRSFIENGEGFKIINIDDALGKKMAKKNQDRVFTYSLKEINADLSGKIRSIMKDGTILEINYAGFKNEVLLKDVFSDFMCENILAAMSAGICEGFTIENCLAAMASFRPPKGRMERIENQGGVIYVDYAHTPDALDRVLINLKGNCQGKLMVVFGCGGNRDSSKRAVMGSIAGRYADFIIITSDNPRFEDAALIAAEIADGIDNEVVYEIINDREKAILKALSLLKNNDVLLIAGKGHEHYQITGDEKRYFNDYEFVLEAIQKESM